MKKEYKIYLAGPDVFRDKTKMAEKVLELKTICNKYNTKGIFPLDKETKRHDDESLQDFSFRIFRANTELIDDADAVFANMETFRGPNVDDGTAFEMGYAFAKKKKVYGYSPTSNQTYDQICKAYYENLKEKYLKQLKDTFPEIEEFDNTANLMLAGAIYDTKGKIFPTFEECIIHLTTSKINQKRVVAIVNKSWELEPVLNALLNREFNYGLIQPENKTVDFPKKSKQGDAVPRAIWSNASIRIELWCIQDIMEPPKHPLESSQQYFSSSSQKDIDINKIFNGNAPMMVIAFGTAGCPDKISYNGSVVLGSNIYMHDGHPASDPNKYSALRDLRFEQLISSNITDEFFNTINILLSDPSSKDHFTKRFLSSPLNPSSPDIIAHKDYLALSNINVTNYHEYVNKDQEGIKAVEDAKLDKRLISVETTHGIIRLKANEIPFVFLSAISDVVGRFDTEMFPKDKAQNFTSAFNGGVFLAWLFKKILDEEIKVD